MPVFLGMTYRRSTSTIALTVAALAASVLAFTPSAGAADRTAPSPPQGLRVTGVDYDSIDLSWDAPSGAPIMYYLIYRNGLWVSTSRGTIGSAEYLAAGKTHTIEVRALTTDNRLSAPATISATTRVDAGPPTAPANLRVERDGRGRPTGLAWDESSDDRGIQNYWLSADGSDAFGGGSLGVSFYTLTDEYCTVFSGQTYTFTVRARDLSGNLSSVATPLTVTIP